MQFRNLRFLTAAMGLWVLISSILWREGSANSINMWVTGLVIIASSLAAIGAPRLRFVSAAAGVWLIASLFAWPHYSSPTVWNNCLVGAGVALVSILGPEDAEMFAS